MRSLTCCLILASLICPVSSFRVNVRQKQSHIIRYEGLSSEPNEPNENNESNELFNKIKEFGKQISIPNIMSGAALGSVITLFALFAPYFAPVDGSTNSYRQATSVEKSITLFEDILVDLKNGYVDTVNPEKLFETAVGAMLKSLDPYTEFENLGDAKTMAESVSGKYGGVGMVIAGARDAGRMKIEKTIPVLKDDNENVKGVDDKTDDESNKNIRLSSLRDKGIVVVDAFEGYAFDNKIRVGDKIISIDGRDTTRMDVEGVRSLLRGEPGTILTIEVERDQFNDKPDEGISSTTAKGKVRKSFTITRQQIKMSDVRLATYLGEPKDGIGYIALSGFNADASRDFAQALLMLRYSAPFGLNGLVLDLRGNPGGLLDAAVDIASFLVPPESNIVSAKAKSEPEVVFKSSSYPIRPPGMQLAVMVNGGSASASEIVSGAIQDLDAGIIVGPERTYGKGLVQKIVPLPYDNALKYTVAKYYTPSGRCIQAVKYLGGRDDDTKTQSQSDDNTVVQSQAESVLESVKQQSPTQKSTLSTSPKPVAPVNPGIKEALVEERQRTGDGATLVAENDRQTFYTIGGRPVKDGGGIEPDFLVEPFKMSAIESALLNQNVYADFVSEYLRSSSARTPLSHISEMEQSARVHDIRYDSRVAQSPIARFFVLPTRYSYDSQANYHSGANSEDATGADSIAGRRYIMSSILRGKNPDAFTAKTSLPTVLPSKADVASNDLSNQWESELLTLKDTKRTTQSTGDKLFTDFKRFVERKYAAGEIALEGVVGERLDALEKALHEEGLEKAEEGFKNLRPQIGRNLLAEMDKHRAFISDSLELTLLSRELPDRLLVYRAIVSDPQVEEARKLLTGSITKLGLTDTGEVNSVIKDPITTTPTITMESPTSESKVPELGAVLVKRVPALS